VNRQIAVQKQRRSLALVAVAILAAACNVLRHSSNPDASCPVPPVIALARWTSIPDSGVIEGAVLRVRSVTDQSPQPLEDVNVALAGPVHRTSRTDSAGHFRLIHLPAGDYLVRIQRVGFPTRDDSLRIGAGGFRGEIRLRSAYVAFTACCHAPYCV
jgi:Carboxypeptidase regulatory-like domain